MGLKIKKILLNCDFIGFIPSFRILDETRYKSIFLNKHMENVLNYIYGNIKDQIITEQIKDQEEIAMSNLKKNEELKK